MLSDATMRPLTLSPHVANDYPGGIHARQNTPHCQAAPSPISPKTPLIERSFHGSVSLIPTVGRLAFLSIIGHNHGPDWTDATSHPNKT